MQVFRSADSRLSPALRWAGVLAIVTLVAGAILFILLRPTTPQTPAREPVPASKPIPKSNTPEPRVVQTPTRTESPAPLPSAAPPNQPATVNLLQFVRFSRDTVSGAWWLDGTTLRSNQAQPARLEFPYTPPAEYDFRITFSVPEPGCVGQVLYANGQQFGWYMGAYTNRRAGFQMIDGKAMPENPTGVMTEGPFLELNRTYTSLIEVRKTGVKAYLDGKLLSQWTTNFQDMSLFPESRLRNTDVIGLWTSAAAATFHTVEVREVSGKGSSPLERKDNAVEF